MGKAEFGSRISMRGDLSVTVRDSLTNEIVWRHEIRNKITFLAADALVEMLAQRATDPTPDKQSIYSMRMGSSNTPASRADTNLGAFVIGKVLNDVDKVTGVPGELEFSATLSSAEGNGSTLQEAGLFTKGTTPSASNAPGIGPGDTRLFARQIHPPVPKTSAISIEYSWRIAFSA